MKSILVKATSPYTLNVGRGLLTDAHLPALCLRLERTLVIVTDEIVKVHWGAILQQHLATYGLTVELLSFPAGEQYKTRETKAYLENELLQLQCGRDTCLIALGGGVVLDMVGFLAATYCRGLPVIYIPTTLLAMVDASLGGKTGVNTPFGKNLIGTISSPHSIYVDVNTLTTFPRREWKNGVVEMMKHTLLKDASQFDALHHFKYEVDDALSALIFENCLIKKNIVEQDENEAGLRQLLNLGHTIGHGIEAIERYALTHGEAVAVGLLVEGYIAMRLNLLPEAEFYAIESLLKQFDLPLKTNAFCDPERFMDRLALDKKSRRKVPRFVLLERIACPYQVSQHYSHVVDETVLLEALQWAHRRFKEAS